MNKDIEKAIAVLKKGGIIIFPTDTAFGIGCAMDNEKAVERLFAIRKRPVTQATPVLVDTVKMAQEYLQPIPKKVIDELVEPYWPGALTIVLPCLENKVLERVRGGTNTLGVRIPNHPIARAIVQGLEKPILGPSANFHEEKTPYTFEQVDKHLVEKVDYVVRGETTSNVASQASTVIDCTKDEWKIVRQGAVTISNYELGIMNYGRKKKNIRLFIDTASNEEIIVVLEINGKKDNVKQKIGKQKAQVVLPLLDKLLKKHNLGLENIAAIEVNAGPGSFTGLRVGIAIAQALGFALDIPVNGKKSAFVTPQYF